VRQVYQLFLSCQPPLFVVPLSDLVCHGNLEAGVIGAIRAEFLNLSEGGMRKHAAHHIVERGVIPTTKADVLCEPSESPELMSREVFAECGFQCFFDKFFVHRGIIPNISILSRGGQNKRAADLRKVHGSLFPIAHSALYSHLIP